jgi:hypothetical protein
MASIDSATAKRLRCEFTEGRWPDLRGLALKFMPGDWNGRDRKAASVLQPFPGGKKRLPGGGRKARFDAGSLQFFGDTV